MSRSVEFSAKVAVGINGVAIMEIWEKPTDDCLPQGLILDDINNIGLDEWFEWVCTNENRPQIPAIYAINGTARFSEDDVDYHASQIRLISYV